VPLRCCTNCCLNQPSKRGRRRPPQLAAFIALACPISFHTTRRPLLSSSWTGVSFPPVLAPGRGLAVGRECRTHQAKIPAFAPLVAALRFDPHVDRTYSVADHCGTPIANELHFYHDGHLADLDGSLWTSSGYSSSTTARILSEIASTRSKSSSTSTSAQDRLGHHMAADDSGLVLAHQRSERPAQPLSRDWSGLEPRRREQTP
jgi:hypothetical protein